MNVFRRTESLRHSRSERGARTAVTSAKSGGFSEFAPYGRTIQTKKVFFHSLHEGVQLCDFAVRARRRGRRRLSFPRASPKKKISAGIAPSASGKSPRKPPRQVDSGACPDRSPRRPPEIAGLNRPLLPFRAAPDDRPTDGKLGRVQPHVFVADDFVGGRLGNARVGTVDSGDFRWRARRSIRACHLDRLGGGVVSSAIFPEADGAMRRYFLGTRPVED